MDAVTFISDTLRQVQLRLLATCQGLTQDQVLWRPASYANNIGFILWHLTRAEDTVISNLGADQPDLWDSEGWHDKFDQPATSRQCVFQADLQLPHLPLPAHKYATGQAVQAMT